MRRDCHLGISVIVEGLNMDRETENTSYSANLPPCDFIFLKSKSPLLGTHFQSVEDIYKKTAII
jgi:hypothetical protein